MEKIYSASSLKRGTVLKNALLKQVIIWMISIGISQKIDAKIPKINMKNHIEISKIINVEVYITNINGTNLTKIN